MNAKKALAIAIRHSTDSTKEDIKRIKEAIRTNAKKGLGFIRITQDLEQKKYSDFARKENTGELETIYINNLSTLVKQWIISEGYSMQGAWSDLIIVIAFCNRVI